MNWVAVKKCILDAFEIEGRNSTIETEIFAGYIHFITCLYVFPVVPAQLSDAGYDKVSSIEATALACGVGCILSGYITNLPFVIAPPTSVSIYLAVSLQQQGMNRTQADSVVILSGCALLLVGIFKPITAWVTRLIPDCIQGFVVLLLCIIIATLFLWTKIPICIVNCFQASTAVGIGLITALAGAIELDLVVAGKYTLVEMGPITPGIIIALLATLLIAYASHHKVKGAFMLGLVFGTFAYWIYDSDSAPRQLVRWPKFTLNHHVNVDHESLSLLANLLFLYILTLSGLARSMSDLAGLTQQQPLQQSQNNNGNSISSPNQSASSPQPSASLSLAIDPHSSQPAQPTSNSGGNAVIPRGHGLYLLCGFATILSGFCSGPPILISPETAGGIAAGARTGLSAVVCGMLFLATVFFCPLYSAVPPAGTSPLLILVGLTLFRNTSRIQWPHAPEAIPAFLVLLLIPFTYSILAGVGIGLAMYVAIALVTGDLWQTLVAQWQRWRRHPPFHCCSVCQNASSHSSGGNNSGSYGYHSGLSSSNSLLQNVYTYAMIVRTCVLVLLRDCYDIMLEDLDNDDPSHTHTQPHLHHQPTIPMRSHHKYTHAGGGNAGKHEDAEEVYEEQRHGSLFLSKLSDDALDEEERAMLERT